MTKKQYLCCPSHWAASRGLLQLRHIHQQQRTSPWFVARRELQPPCGHLARWKNSQPQDLVPADTLLFLQTACSVNREGQIIGIAVTKGSATDYHAYGD